MEFGSFGAGLAGGIAQGLALRRREARDKDEKARENSRQMLDFLVRSGQVNDVADLGPVFDHAFGFDVESGGGKGKRPKAGEVDQRTQVVNMLNHVIGQKMQPGPMAQPQAPIPQASASPGFMGPQDQPPLESRQVGVTPQPKERRSLGGVPLLSREEVQQRDLSEGIESSKAQIMAKISLAKRLLPLMQKDDPNYTMDDARADAGLSRTANRQVSFQRVAGTVDGKDMFAIFDPSSGGFLDAETHQPLQNFVPMEQGANYRYGVNREALAKSMFGDNYGNLTTDQAQQVIDAEKALLEAQAKSRGTGSAAAKFEAPAGSEKSQRTGVAVGTSDADIAGQQVPTAPERERVRSVNNLKAELEHIKKDLLGPLPKDTDLVGGAAPGAVFTARRRMPSYRTQIASLESALNGIVNVVARSVGEQRGTQTEQDAIRAEAGIVALRDSLLVGDTQESAAARIDETLSILERILSTTPTVPVAAPKATAPAAPGAAPAAAAPTTGFTMKDGALYFNGKKVE